MNEIKGDLTKLALEGKFDVIAHGCNCQRTMGAGISLTMTNHFEADLEDRVYSSNFDNNINMLGTIHCWKAISVNPEYPSHLTIVNAYTQYKPGKNLDYDALKLCLRKINHIFKGKHIGLPLIGCGIAGGIWDYSQLPQFEFDNYLNNEYLQYVSGIKKDVKTIIQEELKDMNITIVHYE